MALVSYLFGEIYSWVICTDIFVGSLTGWTFDYFDEPDENGYEVNRNTILTQIYTNKLGSGTPFSILRLELVVGALTTIMSSVPLEAHAMAAAVEAMDDERETLHVNKLPHPIVVAYFLNFETTALKYILQKAVFALVVQSDNNNHMLGVNKNNARDLCMN